MKFSNLEVELVKDALLKHKSNNNFVEVAIIPYTFENTNFKQLKINDMVNIEYDILGKYILKNITK